MGYNIDNFVCVGVCMCMYMHVLFNIGQSNQGSWDLYHYQLYTYIPPKLAWFSVIEAAALPL